jgi:hypothetical protein
MSIPLTPKPLTADAVVSAVPCFLSAVLLTAGSDTATIILYDNATTTSGTIVAKLSATANTTASFTPNNPVNCKVGLYADVGGTAMAAYCYLQ